MTIRLAKPSDKNQILELVVELANHIYDLTKKPRVSIADLGVRAFDEILKRDDIKFFVAEDKNVLVGFASLYILPNIRREKPKGEIEEFVITKKYRGKGVGKKLFQTVLDYCKSHNVYALKLTSGIELEGAHAFYEKMGGVFTEKLFRFDISG